MYIMSKKTVNVQKAMKESTEFRISPDVVEEVAARLSTEFIPLITEALADRARGDSRKTIQEKDLAFFDFRDWWRLLRSDYYE